MVTCENPALRRRVVGVLEMAQSTITSLARGFIGAGIPGRIKVVAQKDEEKEMQKEGFQESGHIGGTESKINGVQEEVVT